MPEKKTSKAKQAATSAPLLATLTALLTVGSVLAAEKYIGPGSGAIVAGALTGGALVVPAPSRKK